MIVKLRELKRVACYARAITITELGCNYPSYFLCNLHGSCKLVIITRIMHIGALKWQNEHEEEKKRPGREKERKGEG